MKSSSWVSDWPHQLNCKHFVTNSAHLAKRRPSGCRQPCFQVGSKPSIFENVFQPSRTLRLKEADYKVANLKERWVGAKPIEQADGSIEDVNALATLINYRHKAESLTLVVVNTVNRSRILFDVLRKLYQPKRIARGKKTPASTDPLSVTPDIKLIHSRFRPHERDAWMGWLKTSPPAEGRIIISTQIVEAGVDMSARTLSDRIGSLAKFGPTLRTL